jgi:hypothetical protein
MSFYKTGRNLMFFFDAAKKLVASVTAMVRMLVLRTKSIILLPDERR